MTIKAFTDYPEKGAYSDEKRRSLNSVIHQYVTEVIDIYPPYATNQWHKEKYIPLVDTGDFGKDHTQVIQAQLCILGRQARGSHKEFYEELVEHIPFLGRYLTVHGRSWEMKEPSRALLELHNYAEEVTLPGPSPTKGIAKALQEHEGTLDGTLKGLEEATGTARKGGTILTNVFDDKDDDDDDDDEADKVWDFNKPMTQPGDKDDDEQKEQEKPAEKGFAKGQQLKLSQMTDPDSVARKLLQSKHFEKMVAQAVNSTSKPTDHVAYTKLQGKVTEQQAVNQALKASLADQEKELKIQQQHATELEKKLNTIIKSSTTTVTKPAVKRSPNSLEELSNRTLAEDFLLLNPNKHSNKFFNYYHDGKGYTMQPQNYADSRLPKMKIKYYVDTIGLMRTFALHAVQFGIHVRKIEDIQPWDDRNNNPPTCPYTLDLTHQCDKVYTIAASKIYTKLAQTVELKHPVLQQSFNEAGQYADGYIALYYLQSYGNPKFIDRSVEMPKPTLGQSRDISFFCRNLHNYSMYRTLLGDSPTKLNLYEYVVSQINESFPGEYDKGIKEVEDKINVWRALSTNPAIGPTQPFPQDAEIEGSKLAFSIMRKYTEAEARALFKEDKYNDEEENAVIEKAEVKAAYSSRNNQQREGGTSKYRSENDRDNRRSTSSWKNKQEDRKKYQRNRTSNRSSYTPWKYREGIFCSICGGEGHEAKEDGCFATGRFVRLIKTLDPTMYKKIKAKYGDLLKLIDRKLQESIDQKVTRRKERNAKVTYMELADKACDIAETEDEARQICVNCAYTVFPDIATDSSEEEYESAESS